MNQISHDIHGDRILISVDFPGENVTAHQDGTCKITMDDTEWRETARGVLQEFNRAEKALDPDQVCARIHNAINDAATRTAQIESVEVARMRMTSTVLHRIADMVIAGTVIGFAVMSTAREPGIVMLKIATRHREISCDVHLGIGITDYKIEDVTA